MRGVVAIRQFEEAIRLTVRFAAVLTDPRVGEVEYTLQSMVRQWMYGILAGCEDRNDHDVLRGDPAYRLVCDRLPGEGELASQPTLSPSENAVSIKYLWRLRDIVCKDFLDAFSPPRARITLGMDAFDDFTHGQHHLTFFHEYYHLAQCLPNVITSAETDRMAPIQLRHGICAAWLGVDDDLRYMVRRIHKRFPDVKIIVRGDCGFGVPLMYEVCESLLTQAIPQFEESGYIQRLFLKRG